MHKTLEQKKDIAAQAMKNLCSAITVMATLRDDIERESQKELNAETDRLRLAMHRTCTHLTQAAADLPDEMWAALLDVDNVPAQKLERNLTLNMRPYSRFTRTMGGRGKVVAHV